jgi:hypothetical protein
MKSKQKSQTRRVAKEKVNTVAADSLQSRAPGAGPGRGNQQSSAQPSGFGGDEAGERGGPGAQQAGWSSRQQAERMKARGEESRLGMSQQSGYGGAEQAHHAGSHESPLAPSGGRQAGNKQAAASEVGGTTTKGGSGSRQ